MDIGWRHTQIDHSVEVSSEHRIEDVVDVWHGNVSDKRLVDQSKVSARPAGCHS